MKNLQLSKPHLLVVVGVPGAGKSFFANKFAETFSAPYLDQGNLARIISEDQATVVADLVLDQLVRTKQTILLEGWGSTRTERQSIAAYARKHGYEPLFVWVQTDPETAKRRSTKGMRGQNADHLLSEEQFDKAFKRFTLLGSSEKYMVISGKHTYASQAKIVLKKLVEPRASAQSTISRQTLPAPTTRGRITVK